MVEGDRVRARLTAVLLALLVVCDVVLVTLSLRRTATLPSEVGAVRSIGMSTPSPSAPPSSAGTPEGPSSPATVTAVDEPTHVDVSAAGDIVRSTRGDCATARQPVVSVSIDHGSTFGDHRVDGLAEVLRVAISEEDSLSVVGLDAACHVARWSSTNAGRSWSMSKGAGAAWFLIDDPTQRAVSTPAGRHRTPCVPLAVSPVDATVARLLCDDGRVEGTSDAGASWVPLGRLDGAVSIDFATPGDGSALATQEGCRAAVLATSDGGTTWSQTACLQGAEPRAISRQDDEVVAVVGAHTSISADGGRTWTQG